MSDYNPLISVVIPTYNRGNIIERTINSVLQQTYKNIEVLIIDDASNDDTENIVKNIEDKRIRYIRLAKNTSGTKPRNTGIKLSKGEFIAFLDSDDEWFPEKLEKQLNHIYNSEGPSSNVLCFTDLIINYGNKKKKKKNRTLKPNEDIMDYIFLGNNVVQTSTFMVSAYIAKKTLFDSNLKKHQDWDFCIRLKNNGATFLHMPECLSIWNTDNRSDRITNSYNDNVLSLSWMNERNQDLSTRAQWAFKSYVIVPNLIAGNKKGNALGLTCKALFYRGIDIYSFIKNLIKIILPKKVLDKVIYIFYKVKSIKD